MLIKPKIFSYLLIMLAMVAVNTADADIPANHQKSKPTSVVQEDTGSPNSIVIGNKDTKRYHLPGMPYYNKVKKYHRVYFDSEQQAIAHGYYRAGTGRDLRDRVSRAGVKKTDKEATQAVVYAPVTPPSPVTSAADVVINYKIIIAFIFFIFLFFLPFLPAIAEIFRKQDSYPLFIPMDYNKDPRYFCHSFKQILHKAIAGLPGEPQISEVMLSHKEKVQITESIHIAEGEEVENLLYVRGDISSDMNAHFKKEVYVSGNADIGGGNVLRVLAAEGKMTIAAETTFERWLDSQGDLDVGPNCHLGISASSGGRLNLAENCSFRRLYGMPVTTKKTGKAAGTDFPAAALPMKMIEKQESSFIRKTDGHIKEGSLLDGNFVFLNDVRIGRNSVVRGSMKCYGDVELEEGVTVDGNIFADGEILIGKGSVVRGHLFSQNSILVSEHCVISRFGVIKSVLGKKSVRLAPNVTIYGYIATEGKGKAI